MLARGSFGFPLTSSDQWEDSRSGCKDLESPSPSDPSTGAKPKRKRPKFIRKVECQVCGDIANDHIHYGAIACYSCRAFFRRGVNANSPYYCSQEKKCVVNKQTRKHCQYCRFQKCLVVGMKPSWVMTEEDKREKRERAILRKLSLEAKKAEKCLKKQGASSMETPRLVDVTDSQYDFNLQRSTLPMPPSPPPLSNSPNRDTRSPKREPPSPNFYVKDEPMSPGSLHLQGLTISEFSQVNHKKPMTHESGYSSSSRSPGNALEDRPSSPDDEDRHSGATEDYIGAMALRAAVDGDVIIGNELVSFKQPVMPFTLEEKQLVDNLIKIELDTAEMIPVPFNVMYSMIEAARSGQNVPYQTTLEGYTVCMKRIIKYASQLDIFQSFSGADQRNLLLANTDMLVNIKSARLLRPGVNLRDQLVFAVGNASAAEKHIVPFTTGGKEPSAPLVYKQIYQSPWASSAEHEEKFQNMMKNIFDLKMDRFTTTLMAMMALFSVSHAEIEERDRAMQNQEFFSQLLYRYLCSAIGKQNAIQLLPRYMYLLSELEEMAQIMVTKRLLL